MGSDQRASFFIIADGRYSKNVPSVSMEELERAFSSNTAPVVWPGLDPGISPDRAFFQRPLVRRGKIILDPFFLEGSRQLERFSAKIRV